MEGNWQSGMKNGVFKFYTRKGDLEKIERYENDVLIIDEASTAILDIRKEYHANGAMREMGTYRNGKKQKIKYWKSKGQKVAEKIFTFVWGLKAAAAQALCTISLSMIS